MSVIISLAATFNVELGRRDVALACYINRKRHVLVKLNCAEFRDQIMRKYFQSRSLQLRDVLPGVGGDISRRLYLNDHFSPAASRLNSICTNLRKQNIITKFRILNGETKARLTMPDGSIVVRDINECSLLIPGQSTSSN